MKNKSKFPKGWDEKRVKGLIDHYEQQTEDEALAEDEAPFVDDQDTMMEIPRKLVSQVREMIAQHNKKLLKTGN